MDAEQFTAFLQAVGTTIGISVGQELRNRAVDSKILPTQKNFSVKEEAWPSWCLKMESLFSLMIPLEELGEAARMEDPRGLAFDLMAPDTASRSKQIFIILVDTCEGIALSIIR